MKKVDRLFWKAFEKAITYSVAIAIALIAALLGTGCFTGNLELGAIVTMFLMCVALLGVKICVAWAARIK